MRQRLERGETPHQIFVALSKARERHEELGNGWRTEELLAEDRAAWEEAYEALGLLPGEFEEFEEAIDAIEWDDPGSALWIGAMAGLWVGFEVASEATSAPTRSTPTGAASRCSCAGSRAENTPRGCHALADPAVSP